MPWYSNHGGGSVSYRWITDAKSNAPLSDIVRALGLRLSGRGNRFGPCLACHAERTRNDTRGPVSLNLERGTWRCWTCQAHGSVVDLVACHLLGDVLDPTDPTASRDVRAWFAERGYLAGEVSRG